MLRVITLVATFAAAGTLAGTAGAHQPDLYDRSYEVAPCGCGYSPAYPSYGAADLDIAPYAQSTYSPPVYRMPTRSTVYTAPAYIAPRYSGVRYGAAPYDATPLYTKTYATPYYPAPRQSYGGYSAPRYGYRHSGGGYQGAYRYGH